MGPGRYHPDAIDTRLVFRIYAWLATTTGLAMYGWPLLFPDLLLPFSGIAWGEYALIRIAGAVMVGSGICAAGLARVDDPVNRRRGLLWFAIAHLVFGAMFYLQWHAIFSEVLPPFVGWAPLVVGTVLLYIAVTALSTRPLRRAFVLVGPHDPDTHRGFVVDTRLEAVDSLRSQFEEQIRQATRLEERSRLARDLHDAVKQQLFVIQTAAATVEARFDTDAQGAKNAVEQIRTATREAIAEMEAMIDELQATPMENVGLVEALKKQCEALGFRTGADVKLTIGKLPLNGALPLGAQEGLFRAAQEALANVGRHARARHVEVTLGTSGDRLELTVRDDGAGFDPREPRNGMGISNMTARAVELAGTFVLNSSPGAGTLVRLSVPCYAASPREYGVKALGWAVVLAFVIAYWSLTSVSHQPWSIAAAAIVAIMVVRYSVAGLRVHLRTTALT